MLYEKPINIRNAAMALVIGVFSSKKRKKGWKGSMIC
jgi:hypothetical protein